MVEEKDDELLELLQPKTGISLKIKEIFGNLPEKYVILLVEDAKQYTQTNIELARFFVEAGNRGIYISVSKPLETVLELFKENEINTKKIIFIDTISNASGANEVAGENYHYVESPRDLTELSVLLEDSLKEMDHAGKFVIMDSISSLLVHNELDSIKKFVHSLAGKMHSLGVKGILVIVEGMDKETLNSIAQFCDQIVEIDGKDY